jgi:hypothetical protein
VVFFVLVWLDLVKVVEFCLCLKGGLWLKGRRCVNMIMAVRDKGALLGVSSCSYSSGALFVRAQCLFPSKLSTICSVLLEITLCT